MSNRWIILSSALVGGVACVAAAVYFYRRRRCNTVSDYVFIGKVSKLTIYPVKSMRGNSVEEMQCEESGGKYKELRDRYFMVMDADTGKFVTGRQFPKLLTISADVHGGTLFLMSLGRTFELNLEEVARRNEIRQAELHNGLKQEGLDCGKEISAFLRLILEVSNNLRVLYRLKTIETPGNETANSASIDVDPLSYSEDTPYMTICESSLDDLNSRLPSEDQVDMRWFRPVIQISGPSPYDEDRWSELKIDAVTFARLKPCTRCAITTVNPDTGIRRENNQPIKILREYRMGSERVENVYNQNPMFGICMSVVKKGTIRVGDAVYARYKQNFQ